MQLDAAATTHLVGDGLVALLVTITGWLMARKVRDYDTHLKECAAKEVNHATIDATLQGQVKALDGRCGRIETTMDKMDKKIDVLLLRKGEGQSA